MTCAIVSVWRRGAQWTDTNDAHQSERMSVAQFYRTSTVWVVEFTYDGHPRRWLKALPQGTDGRTAMESHVNDLYGARARVSDVRPATTAEELQYIRGEVPKNVFCPTGRAPARRT
jgi:hypothetical protein